MRRPVLSPLGRWLVVVVLAAAVVGVPRLLALRPVAGSDVSAAALLSRVQGAADHPYSGYVESVGSLSLPSSDRLSDVGALLGQRSRLRVWWRASGDWRVDQLATAGETDLVHHGDATTSYDYAAATAITAVDPGIRLPRASDLTPPALGHTAVAAATDADVERIPSRRVAGLAAPGLRIVPASPHSSIDHVDLWADPATGVPLRVEVYAVRAAAPAFTTAFDSFDAGTPSAATTAFVVPPDVDGRTEPALDIAEAADQYAPLRTPDTVAGLTRSSTEAGAVGVYGTGLTRIIAVPLRHQEADPLRTGLGQTPGSRLLADPTLTRLGDGATTVAIGPLDLLVTGKDGDGGFLVAGTVDRATLTAAAVDLLQGTVYTGGRP